MSAAPPDVESPDADDRGLARPAGFLVVDKPVGPTSRDIVNIAQVQINAGRRRRDRIKVGHTGTLDPLATGVLIVAIGVATRLTPWVGDMAKRYRGTFRLNQTSDSGDLDGEITSHALPLPTPDQLATAAAAHVGEIQQTPPAHSAIKIDGRRAYDRVRAGETVDMPTRTVRIDQIDLIRYDEQSNAPEFEIDVRCGGGTYMRTLGADIAAAAGNAAVMTSLTRTAVGPFCIDDAIDFQTLKSGDWRTQVQPLVTAAADLPKVTIHDADLALVANGVLIPITTPTPPEQAAAIDQTGNLRAILRRRDQHWHPSPVFR